MIKRTYILVICLIIAAAAAASVQVVTVSNTKSLSLAPTIIVDAGHGGFDGGAEGHNNVIEKDINLAISKKLRAALELSGFEVIMVREDDVATYDESAKKKKTSDIKNRLKLTEQYPNAIYLSIHQNIYQQSSSWGSQVFYGPKNEQSKRLAEIVQTTIVNQLQPENHRKIKKAQSNLYILSNSKVPTILIECGFLSNYKESELLQDDEYQQKLAYLILESVIKFYKES